MKKKLTDSLVKRPIEALVHRLGYEMTRPDAVTRESGFELYGYRRPDGTFDYERYKWVQTAGNREKIENAWVLEENISFLADYLARNLGRVKFGLCHGTRRGKEQEWFSKYLGC